MKIIRDGKAIELTHEEMLKAYDEMDIYYKSLDVISRAEEDGIVLGKQAVCEIAQSAQRMLENHSYYMDIYWDAIDEAINRYVDDKKHLKQVNTKVGTFYADRYDAGFNKIRLYDSNGRYLDYWEPEIIVGHAEDANCNPVTWWCNTLNSLESVDNIHWLLHYLGVAVDFVTTDKQELCDHLGDDDAPNNDMVNIIGEYYIVVRD